MKTINNKNIKALLFDIDGTLFDSIHCLHTILNSLLSDHQQAGIDKQLFRGHIDKGSKAWITYFFNLAENHPDVEKIKSTLLTRYLETMATQTDFFPHIEQTLSHLNSKGIHWGIVTNRPRFLMQPLLDHFPLLGSAKAVVCSDSVKQAKPSPASLLQACHILAISPAHAVYIGDTQNDMIAAKNAGMRGMFARYGYLRANSTLNASDYDALIDTPKDLATWVNRLDRQR